MRNFLTSGEETHFALYLIFISRRVKKKKEDMAETYATLLSTRYRDVRAYSRIFEDRGGSAPAYLANEEELINRWDVSREEAWGARVRTFSFRATNFVDPAAGYVSDFAAMLRAIDYHLHRLQNLYPGSIFQVLLRKFDIARGPEGADFVPAGVDGNMDVDALVGELTTFLQNVDTRQPDDVIHGSDEDTLAVDILSTAFTIRVCHIPVAGCHDQSTVVGNLAVTSMDKDGCRRLRNNYYYTRDNVKANRDDNCLLWAIKVGLGLPSKFNYDKIRRRIGVLKGPIPTEKFDAVCQAFEAETGQTVKAFLIADEPDIVHDFSRASITNIKESVVTVERTENFLEHYGDISSGDNVITLVWSSVPAGSGHCSLLIETKYPTYDLQSGIPLGHGRITDVQREEYIKANSNSEERIARAKPVYRPAVDKTRNIAYDMFVFFDLETVFAKDSEIFPYSNAVIFVSKDRQVLHKEYFNLATLGMKDDEQGKYAVIAKLLHLLDLHCVNYKRVLLTGFHNSRFDNFPLQQCLAKMGKLHKHSIFTAGNSILKLTWSKYTVWDLNRFTMNSLAKAAQDYKCTALKTGQDHAKIQLLYEQGQLLPYLRENHKELEDYNMNDCVVTNELFWKLRDGFSECLELKGKKQMEHSLTLAKLTEECWRMSYRNYITKLVTEEAMNETNTTSRERRKNATLRFDGTAQKLSQNQLKERIKELVAERTVQSPEEYVVYKFFRKSIYGGRSQIFQVGCFTGEYDIIDVVSLYPDRMINCSYPVGAPIPSKTFQAGKKGIYHVTVNFQLEHLDNVVPLRSEDEDSLDWVYKGSFKANLTNVDIELLWEFHGVESCTVHYGFYWERECPMVFSNFLHRILSMKKLQDTYKSNNDPAYNPSLRNICKLVANGLSGKMAQRNFPTDILMVDSPDHFDVIMAGRSSYESFQFIQTASNRLVFKGVKSPQAVADEYDPKKTYPCHIASFIYAESRAKMYRLMVRCPGKLGMDTDSLFIPRCDVEKLRRESPEIFGKEIGQFDFEMQEKYEGKKIPYTADSVQRFYTVAPKCYAVEDVATGKAVKMRFKGVSEKARLLSRDTLMAIQDPGVRSACMEFFNVTWNERGELVQWEVEDRAPRTATGGWQALDLLPQALTLGLFQELLTGRQVMIVQSQIIKKVIDGEKMGVLKQAFPLKQLSIKRKLGSGEETPKKVKANKRL